MKNTLGRSAVTVLLVTIIGISLAATSRQAAEQMTARVERGPLAQAQESAASATPTAKPDHRAADRDSSGPDAPAEPTSTAPPALQASLVSFHGLASYPDGVTVQVAKIKRTELRRPASGAGVKKGDPIQILSVRVTNGSSVPLSLMNVQPVITYGTKQEVASAVRSKSWRPLTGTIAAGRSQTGTYGFAVPKAFLSTASLAFGFSAGHAPATFRGSLDYTPRTGVLFNDPLGSRAEQLAIIRHVERSIRATPKGGTIRIAHYSFDHMSSAKALLAAYDRGVNVQMIVDQHENIVTEETQSLIDELGENRKSKSFLIRCKASCMSNRTSAMHAKFFLFSSVGAASQVSMITSSNLTHTNSRSSWNDIQTLVGEKVVYASLTKYFLDMLPDKNRPNYFRTTTSGQYKLYFYPRSARHGGDKPSLMKELNTVRCSGAAVGYGNKDGKTVIRVTMYSWGGSRVDIAQKLWRLHNAGCQVQVIYNSGRTGYAVSQALLRHSVRYGQLDLHDAWLDRNYNDKPELYMHQKALAISGVADGRADRKVVYAGSQNFTPNATLDNNEIIFRNTNDAIYDAYAANFKDMRAHTRLRTW